LIYIRNPSQKRKIRKMSKRRHVPPPTPLYNTQPFISAEEAWFWFIRCQKARADGARFERAMGATVRPCDPDDVYRAVTALHRRRILNRRHMNVLERYGLLERPPDKRCRDEERPFALWDEALDRLTTVLRGKEIIE
jgi:hypothetical protein